MVYCEQDKTISLPRQILLNHTRVPRETLSEVLLINMTVVFLPAKTTYDRGGGLFYLVFIFQRSAAARGLSRKQASPQLIIRRLPDFCVCMSGSRYARAWAAIELSRCGVEWDAGPFPPAIC